MSIKKPLLCKICGSNNIVEKNGKWFCQACETYYNKNEFSSEDIKQIAAQDRAEAYLRYSVPRFEDAREQFEILCNDYPNMSSPYWGLLRAKYGIKYQIDGSNSVPTPYSDYYEDIRNDPLFEKCLKLAESESLRKKYESEAKRIAKNSEEWENRAKKISFDIFLSFKATDDSGRDTVDRGYVHDLYDFLKERGYKVFYAPVSMKEYTGEPIYDAYIFNAINKAKVMIVYGSKPEYFSSRWVQNEWTRYIKLMEIRQKAKNSLIIAYKNINPSKDLPAQFSNRQMLDCSSPRAFETIYKKVKSVISPENQEDEITLRAASRIIRDKEIKLKKADEEIKKAQEEAKRAEAKSKKWEEIAKTKDANNLKKRIKRQEQKEENERRKKELKNENKIKEFVDVDGVYYVLISHDSDGKTIWSVKNSKNENFSKEFYDEKSADDYCQILIGVQRKKQARNNYRKRAIVNLKSHIHNDSRFYLIIIAEMLLFSGVVTNLIFSILNRTNQWFSELTFGLFFIVIILGFLFYKFSQEYYPKLSLLESAPKYNKTKGYIFSFFDPAHDKWIKDNEQWKAKARYVHSNLISSRYNDHLAKFTFTYIFSFVICPIIQSISVTFSYPFAEYSKYWILTISLILAFYALLSYPIISSRVIYSFKISIGLFIVFLETIYCAFMSQSIFMLPTLKTLNYALVIVIMVISPLFMGLLIHPGFKEKIYSEYAYNLFYLITTLIIPIWGGIIAGITGPYESFGNFAPLIAYGFIALFCLIIWRFVRNEAKH